MKEGSLNGLGLIDLFGGEPESQEILIYKHNMKRKKEKAESVQNLIFKADSGSRIALFKLISIDKRYLFRSFAEKMILEAQEKRDYDFFENLSDAIKKIPKSSSSTSKKPNKNEIWIRAIAVILEKAPSYKKNVKKLFNDFHEKYGSNPNFPKDWYSLEYFRKLLRRKGLIPYPSKTENSTT